jgi:hypothetical protein
MCFYTRRSVTKAEVAKHPIIAFKLMENVTMSGAESPFRSTKWTVGRVKKAGLRKELNYGGQDIERGLHCFKTAASARRYMHRRASHKVTVVMIPKGALYYENDTQYVSNEMILLGTDLSVFRKIAKVVK